MIQANNQILNEEMNAVMNTEVNEMNNKEMNNKERGQVKRRIGWLRGKIEEYGNELSELLSSIPEVEEKVRGKGRPTKAKKAPEEVEDLFAKLVISNIKNTEVVEVVEVVDWKADLDAALVADLVEETPKKSNKPKKHMLTEEEKEAKKAALEEEKLAKKVLEKEQKAFLEAEKKILKKLEDDKKKQALEEEKASKKVPKKSTKKQAVEAVPVPVPVQDQAPVPEEKATKVTVTRITIGDMKYLKSNTNVLYNETTKEEVGLYDAETNTIKPLPEDDDAEMTEDEYYESDNDRY